MVRYFTVFVFCFFIFDIASAQYYSSRNGNRNFLITAGTGTTHYYGDLARNGDNGNIRPNFFVGARYNFYGWFSAGADLGWFQLQGDDRKDPIKATRNLSFLSNNYELNFTLQASLFQERKFYLRRFANPFVYAGLGIVNFNPTAELDGTRYKLRPLETEGVKYSNIALNIPIGGGVRFRVNPFFNIIFDWSYHFTTTDYLDDVSSGVYPAPSSFSSDIARKLSDRTWETLPPGNQHGPNKARIFAATRTIKTVT